MACYDVYGPTNDELHESFQRAAAKREGYMLVLCKTGNDPMQVTDWIHTETVKSAADILPLLRGQAEKWPNCFTFRLLEVFDLSAGKTFDDQQNSGASTDFTKTLPADVCAGLAGFGRDMKYRNELAEWNSKPWLTRLLGVPPTPPRG